VAELPAGAQQVEASARTSHVTFLQDNVAAPYAKPFAPWWAQKLVGLGIDVHFAGGAGLQQVLASAKGLHVDVVQDDFAALSINPLPKS
jgi:hypothetical protein